MAVGGAWPLQPPHCHDLMDHYVPMAHLARAMTRVLPGHAQISDQAKDMIQAGVFEFVSLLTSGANQRRRNGRRLTITGEDVAAALVKHGFDDYIEPLYITRYRQAENVRESRLPPGAPASPGLPPRPPRPPRLLRQTVSVGKKEAVKDDDGAAATVTSTDSEEGTTSSPNPNGNKWCGMACPRLSESLMLLCTFSSCLFFIGSCDWFLLSVKTSVLRFYLWVSR